MAIFLLLPHRCYGSETDRNMRIWSVGALGRKNRTGRPRGIVCDLWLKFWCLVPSLAMLAQRWVLASVGSGHPHISRQTPIFLGRKWIYLKGKRRSLWSTMIPLRLMKRCPLKTRCIARARQVCSLNWESNRGLSQTGVWHLRGNRKPPHSTCNENLSRPMPGSFLDSDQCENFCCLFRIRGLRGGSRSSDIVDESLCFPFVFKNASIW